MLSSLFLCIQKVVSVLFKSTNMRNWKKIADDSFRSKPYLWTPVYFRCAHYLAFDSLGCQMIFAKYPAFLSTPKHSPFLRVVKYFNLPKNVLLWCLAWASIQLSLFHINPLCTRTLHCKMRPLLFATIQYLSCSHITELPNWKLQISKIGNGEQDAFDIWKVKYSTRYKQFIQSGQNGQLDITKRTLRVQEILTV